MIVFFSKRQKKDKDDECLVRCNEESDSEGVDSDELDRGEVVVGDLVTVSHDVSDLLASSTVEERVNNNNDSDKSVNMIEEDENLNQNDPDQVNKEEDKNLNENNPDPVNIEEVEDLNDPVNSEEDISNQEIVGNKLSRIKDEIAEAVVSKFGNLVEIESLRKCIKSNCSSSY